MENNEKNSNSPMVNDDKNNGSGVENISPKSEVINDKKCESISAGYSGSQKYSVGEYAKYGIRLEKNVWSKDKFFIGRTGTPITKDEANEIIDRKRMEDLIDQTNEPKRGWWDW